jgi:hypothetical protein
MRLPLLFFVTALNGCGGGGGAVNDADPDAGGTRRDAAAGDASDGLDASRARHMFVTSKGFTGNLTTLAGEADGLMAADALCNRAAKDAGLAGEFVAYLSVRDLGPGGGPTRLAWERIRGNGPWKAVGSGDVLFTDRAALEGATLPSFRALRTEKGELVGKGLSPTSPRVWTGTPRADKGGGSDTCANWTVAKSGSGGLLPGTCGCLGEHCTAEDWRAHAYGLYPGTCFCQNPTPYEDDQPRLYCFESF